jgi:ribosome biogenesis GTPase
MDTDNQQASDAGQDKQLGDLGWSSFFQNQLEGRDAAASPPARVVGVRKNSFLVSRGDGESLVTPAGSLLHGPEADYPLVGDWVLLRESTIVAILSRQNTLARRASGTKKRGDDRVPGRDQPIAANIDKAFIVCGLDRDFNLRRIERYLTLIYNSGIKPEIVLTKADLHPEPERCVEEVEAVAFGVSVHLVSAEDDGEIKILQRDLSHGRTVAMLGSSGAGKSTLINRLYGEEVRATRTVSTTHGKGRHTTTTRDMIFLPSGGMVIDNPGIREIGLGTEDSSSGSAFPEIDELSKRCRFQDCSHTHEPGCRVLEAVSSGELAPARLESYRKIRRELDYISHRESRSAARVEKDQWKKISQKIKDIKKMKR